MRPDFLPLNVVDFKGVQTGPRCGEAQVSLLNWSTAKKIPVTAIRRAKKNLFSEWLTASEWFAQNRLITDPVPGGFSEP
jgi:hypothetical protein